jgi:hypothetical protein
LSNPAADFSPRLDAGQQQGPRVARPWCRAIPYSGEAPRSRSLDACLEHLARHFAFTCLADS